MASSSSLVKRLSMRTFCSRILTGSDVRMAFIEWLCMHEDTFSTTEEAEFKVWYGTRLACNVVHGAQRVIL